MSDPRHTPPSSDAVRIERALDLLKPNCDALRAIERLKRELTPELARRAAQIFELRRKSSARFPSGELRALTAKGLEQATREPVARARAQRIASIAAATGTRSCSVYDATCGIGADTLALAGAGLRVIAGDRSLEAARCARENSLARAEHVCVILADAMLPPVRADFLVVDPDRRSGGGRTRDGARWSPSLAQVCELAQRFKGACIKLPPGFDIAEAEVHLPRDLRRRWQWVSCSRELCETALWTGELAGTGDGATTEHEALALGLASGAEARIEGRPFVVGSEVPQKVSEIRWLAEPDPSVIRAGLLGNLARELGLAPLGPRNAFLVGVRAPRSELCRAWRVLGVAPADPRRVRPLLAEHDIGTLAIIKRGHPDSGEVLARRFRGRGRRHGLLAIARLERGHLALLLDTAGASGWVGDEGFEPPTSSV